MHLAIYVWAHAAHNPRVRDTLEPLLALLDTLPGGARRGVFRRAREFAVDRLLGAQCGIQLRARHRVGEPLRTLAVLLGTVGADCPLALGFKARCAPHTLVQRIALACRRQICQGAEGAETARVLAALLALVRSVCAVRPAVLCR